MIGDRHLNDFSVEADGLTKYFGDYKAVDRVSLRVPAGSIYGVLGPNGAGKTTSLRMMLGIIDPDEGTSRIFGGLTPQSVRGRIGYLPEERGLYPGMTAREAIAFMGALRGLDWSEGRRRAATFMTELGLERVIDAKIRKMSKGMAQMVQLIGSIVHAPDLIVLDEPFSGLDAFNQGRLETLIREEAAGGATVIFSTHVIAHAERLCERIAIIAGGRIRFEGKVSEARDRLRPRVRLRTRSSEGAWRVALPRGATADEDGTLHFELPGEGIEPLLKALIDGGAGIEELSIERPGLRDAFVAIAGEAAAREMGETNEDSGR